MKVIDFETAKNIVEKLNKRKWENCQYIYAIDDKKLIGYWSYEADYYLKDDSRFYPAPFIQEIIDYIEDSTKWRIFITPRFDGFDRAQIDTYFEIYKEGESGGRDYSSDAHVGNKFESANRAINEVIDLIVKENEK